jgi:hypothetical protein
LKPDVKRPAGYRLRAVLFGLVCGLSFLDVAGDSKRGKEDRQQRGES